MKARVLITGGTQGLGLALARIFSRHDFDVLVCARHQPPEGILPFGVLFKRCDLSSASDIKDLVSSLEHLDMVIHNAGQTHASRLQNLSEEDYDANIQTNLIGLMRLTYAVKPLLLRSERAHVLSIASYQAEMPSIGVSAYAMSKAAVIGFTKSLAVEWGEEGICVNAVMPGFMKTAMTADLQDKALENVLQKNALKRLSSLETIAENIFHWALQRDISGQVYNLDSRILL